MTRSFKTCFCFIILWTTNYAYGQQSSFQYKREIKGATKGYNKLVLPEAVFAQVNNDLSDLRIIAVKNNGDTITVPYIIRVLEDRVLEKEFDFKMLNSSRKGNLYFYTLEIPGRQEINRINLHFQENNFDWKIKLEGSQNLREWFTICDASRIVSIQNKWTDYSFTSLTFPKSSYQYYRFSVSHYKQPTLESAFVAVKDTVPGKHRIYSCQSQNIITDIKSRRTLIDLNLSAKVPVSFVHLKVKDKYDFYRPVTVQYLYDSVQTPKGWKHYYKTISKGHLSAFENNEFKFPGVLTSKLRLIVENFDNEPLTFDGFEIKGNVYEVVALFTDPSLALFLLYGNPSATKPVYDLSKFEARIPSALQKVLLGDEEEIKNEVAVQGTPLFKNQWWLWGIMTLIIFILGGFSLKMIKKA